MHFVIIHLGTAKARHLRPNLQRLSYLFPEIPITLIYSDLTFFREYEDLPINFYKYSEQNDKSHVLNNLNHNSKFRHNFWRYSVERLFALADWHSLHTDARVLHLESDILIMPNFPIEKFASVQTISWCSFNESHDVASIVFSPSHFETAWMAKEIESLLSKDSTLTDMTALRTLKLKYPEKIDYLNSQSAIEIFGGIFDAAPFGMWLCGRDPRNHKGVTRRFLALPESDLDPSAAKFSLGREGNLEIEFPGNPATNLFNLHIHSKQIAIFKKNWQHVVALYVLTSRIKFPKFWFSPSSFIQLLSDAIGRHGLRIFWVLFRNMIERR